LYDLDKRKTLLIPPYDNHSYVSFSSQETHVIVCSPESNTIVQNFVENQTTLALKVSANWAVFSACSDDVIILSRNDVAAVEWWTQDGKLTQRFYLNGISRSVYLSPKLDDEIILVMVDKYGYILKPYRSQNGGKNKREYFPSGSKKYVLPNLEKLHQDHQGYLNDRFPVTPYDAVKEREEIRNCIQSGKCTFSVSGNSARVQNIMFSCRDCDRNDYVYMCESCVKICHAGHKLSREEKVAAVCGCGKRLVGCKLGDKMERVEEGVGSAIRNNTCTFPATGQEKKLQFYLYCPACEIDVCKACATACHGEGHFVTREQFGEAKCKCGEVSVLCKFCDKSDSVSEIIKTCVQDGKCTISDPSEPQFGYKCLPCNIVCCASCVKSCHTGHMVTGKVEKTFSCKCGSESLICKLNDNKDKLDKDVADCIRKGACTFYTTERNCIAQVMYSCETCGHEYWQRSCETCAKVCHAGHKLAPAQCGPFYCYCGAKWSGCKSYKKEGHSESAFVV